MIIGWSLLFSPTEAWQQISQAKRNVAFILGVDLLPLMIVSSLAEGYGLMRWGEKIGEFDSAATLYPQELVFRHEMINIALGLVMIILGGKFIQWMIESFNFEATYEQCFTLVAYGSTPIYLARCVDAFPLLDTWICWALGALGIASVLYQGTAFVLQPSPTKGFGLYLLSVMVVVLLGASCHFIALAILRGKIVI